MGYDKVNKSAKRVDAYEKVTGRAKFGADHYFHNMLYAKVLMSDYPHAEILDIDVKQARELPGVKAVLTADNIPNNEFGVIIENQQVLAKEKTMYIGDGVALVAAESKKIAKRALELIEVEYKELEGVYDPLVARKADAKSIHADLDNNQVVHHPLRKGDVKEGFAKADVILEREYTTQFIEHSYIEPESIVVVPYERNCLVSIYGSIQNPYATRDAVASVLQTDLSNVRVNQNNMGGAFGGKDENMSSMAARAAVLALETERPIKMVNSREESMLESYKRHPYSLQYKVGASEDGELLAMEIEAVADSGAYACQTPFVTWRSVVQATGPYEIPNVKTDTYGFYTNNVYTGAMRGYGSPPTIFAQESLMDELAQELDIKPDELRKKNMYRNGSVTASGQKLNKHEVSLKQVMSEAMEAIDYQEKYNKYSNDQPCDKKRGIGMSISFRGVSLGAEGVDAAGAIVSIQKDGSLIIHGALAENGQGLKTVFSQMVAEELGVSLDSINYMEVDTSVAPESGSTVASRSTLVGGNAVKDAAVKLKGIIKEFTAKEYDLAEENIILQDDYLYTTAGEKIASFKEIISQAYGSGVFLSAYGWYQSPDISWDEETGQGSPYFTYVYGCQIAEVEVDTGTGQVDVLNMTAAHDVGKAINPANVRGQIYGGVVMAMGHCIMEDLETENGYIKTTNFDEYLIPTAKDIPDITPIIVENPDPDGPYGAKSIGEPTLELGSAAISNAVAQATGKRIRDLPLNLERVLIGRSLSKGGNK
ncbi:aerobic-type carbon monoxide dehydrogenase, large subunit CoxL/CutL-like protein [Halobacteroides halobius DSM 5150]|uniref:Aerobic-type carbon monoxide dehydrogenase, large subunit CoxL/CutL-like protein n=1 Tax=Halobacteroides halobius (strain ATCC 35273 / DSM 5150 / MD-1) TaxID=748449 RepID=L0K9G7_HALHC|nr:xanthine dehydrogenase family protein molybdopterin-binding subunit [Halobacteroides halobius]AGB41004.1 aerobic-type carbon monoxide dehydrogenase, large subunit CoxL/CutL-like protein [Halobacteroides halobius DSM 5150]